MMSSKKPALTLTLIITTSFFTAGGALGQPVIEATEELEFDAPESWGMKYFATLALLTSMGVPDRAPAGSIDLGFEGGFVPQLSEEQSRVGFDGTKIEDLNRTHFFGRVRGRIGLSESLGLELAYLPPIELNGTKPHMFAAGIGVPIDLAESFRVGVRGYGQFGTIQGDITCSAEEIESGPNPFDCLAPSNDEVTQRQFGVELTAGYVSESPLRPYAGVAFNYLDLDFQVDAQHSGVIDHTLQKTNGGTVSLTGGVTYVAGERWRFTGELFYSWLSVVRPPSTSSQNDGLFNGRFLVSYRIR
ncbi:MAG: hypothetical protein ACRD21_11305 [Vicinamibacteria bacterium]